MIKITSEIQYIIKIHHKIDTKYLKRPFYNGLANPMARHVNIVKYSKYTFNKCERYLHNFATNNNKLLIVRSVIKEE